MECHPVIAELSRKANVRSERPMSISVIAGFEGVIASLQGRELFNARGSTILFLVAIIPIVVIGMFPNLLPEYQVLKNGIADTDQVAMGRAIMIIMIATAGLTMIPLNASPEEALKGSITRGGIMAVVSIIGVSWLGSSFFELALQRCGNCCHFHAGGLGFGSTAISSDCVLSGCEQRLLPANLRNPTSGRFL